MTSTTTALVLKQPAKADLLYELAQEGVDIILCKSSKRPLTDWTPATLDQLLAHDGLYGVLHPTQRLACVDIDHGSPWAIVQLLKDLEVPYALERTPRPGWHIWIFCDLPFGKLDFNYCGIIGELRTSDCYTVTYRLHLLVELLDSSRKAPLISFFHHLLNSRQPLAVKIPRHANPKTKRRQRKKSQKPAQNQRWKGSGRNNRLSAGIFAALKKREPLDRHIRKAQLDGLPQAEIDSTVTKKYRQRARDVTRREQTLRDNLRRHPLPKTRSDCKRLDVLRQLIDFASHSGLACPKRPTIARNLGCTVRTVTRHTKTLQENGNINKVGTVIAAIHRASGWEPRVNLWSIATHTVKCHTKAFSAFAGWVIRALDSMPASLRLSLSPLLAPRPPPSSLTTTIFAELDPLVAAGPTTQPVASFDRVGVR